MLYNADILMYNVLGENNGNCVGKEKAADLYRDSIP